jgi:hypothetical protein
MRLAVDLLPSSLWGKSLKKMHPDVWHLIRQHILELAGGRCELCAAPAGHVHERWGYHVRTATARVRGLTAVCADCHAVIHFGRSMQVDPSRAQALIAHFCRVNRTTEAAFLQHRARAFTTFERQNRITWQVDHGSWSSPETPHDPAAKRHSG